MNGNAPRVFVTGAGVLSPVGNNVEACWQALIEGKSGAGPITRFDASDYETRFACEVKDFSFDGVLDRKDVVCVESLGASLQSYIGTVTKARQTA